MLSPSQPSTARSPASKSKKRTPAFGRVCSKVVLPTPLGPKIAALKKALPKDGVLFFDLEAGDLAVEGWEGDSIRPRTWEDCRNLAALIGGPNPALREDQPYSQAHFDHVTKEGEAVALMPYHTIIHASIT